MEEEEKLQDKGMQEAPESANPDKTTNTEGTNAVAPIEDKPTDTPDAEDFGMVINILNEIDKDMLEGTGAITGIPTEAQGSIGFIVRKLQMFRDMFEDPDFKAVLDDMADQQEEGGTPSLMVAIARTFPSEKLMELADNEDYAGAREELSGRLAMEKEEADNLAKSEALLEENIDFTKAEAQAYAEEMGYDEEQAKMLIDDYLKFVNLVADGKLTKAEWRQFDKMRNYDKDIEALNAQIAAQPERKEVLPDKPSAELGGGMRKPTPRPAGGLQMGIESLAPMGGGNPYEGTSTDFVNRPKK